MLMLKMSKKSMNTASDRKTRRGVGNKSSKRENNGQDRKQLRILRAFGTVDFDPDYDYKAGRYRKLAQV
jgi:hypothetical protein